MIDKQKFEELFNKRLIKDISEEQIDEAVSILDKALGIGDKEAVETDVPASRSAEFTK